MKAHDVFQAFQHGRDDALFHAILASGGDSESQRKATREKILVALGLVGAGERSAPRQAPFFSAGETAEVLSGCYELLLVLADTLAEPLPRQAPDSLRANTRQALAVLDAAAGLGFQTHAYHLRRARYLDQVGRPDDARKEREQAQRRPPATDLDHYLVGNEHYRQGNDVEAERSFVKALGLKPGHFWARYFLALCHVRQRNLPAARDLLTSCLDQRGSVVWIVLLRGLVRGRMGEYREAESDFQTALELLKKQPDRAVRYVLYNNRAVTSLGQKKYRRAEEDLMQAIALQPDQYHAHFTLSQVYQRQKRLPQALQALDKGIAVAQAVRARNWTPAFW